MAIKDFYPVLRPSLNLDFAGSRTVDPRITFSRASTATYFDELGILRTAPANTPRIDFDPETGECKGLLIEEQRTNLLTYSEQFDNAAWTKTKSSISKNATTAPDGTLTADKLVENTENGTHDFYLFTTPTAGQITLSVYVKSAERSQIAFHSYEGLVPSNPVSVTFDLSSGSVIKSLGLTTAASITYVGNGWYRCTATGTSAGTSTSFAFRISNAGDSTYTGDGTSGIYIWGAQLEQGEFPTSYIPTTTAQVTRIADSASMVGANFSSWYRQDEGTFYAEFFRNSGGIVSGGVPKSPRVLNISDGTTSSIQARLFSDTGIETVSIPGGLYMVDNWTAGQFNKASFALAVNNCSSVLNATTPIEDSSFSGLTSAVNSLQIASNTPQTGGFLNGYIKRIAYYPKRLSNTQLQAITTA